MGKMITDITPAQFKVAKDEPKSVVRTDVFQADANRTVGDACGSRVGRHDTTGMTLETKKEPRNERSNLPITGDLVVIHCNASLLETEEMIDSTHERCQAEVWTVGQGHAIPALEECIRPMRKGQTCLVRAPASLCFGDKGGVLGNGRCPAGSGLLLEVDLL